MLTTQEYIFFLYRAVQVSKNNVKLTFKLHLNYIYIYNYFNSDNAW